MATPAQSTSTTRIEESPVNLDPTAHGASSVFQTVRTDLDVRGLLTDVLAGAEGRDGAEGHPLSFDMSDLNYALDPPQSHSVTSTPQVNDCAGLPARDSSNGAPIFLPQKAIPNSKAHVNLDGCTQSSPVQLPHASSRLSRPSLRQPSPSGPFPSQMSSSRPSPSQTPHSLPSLPRSSPLPPLHPSLPTKTPSSGQADKRPQQVVIEGGVQKIRKQSDAEIARKKAQSKVRSLKARRKHASVVQHSRAPNFYQTPQRSTTKHLPPPQIVKTEASSRELPIARHCWSGKQLPHGRPTVWTVDELLAEGFTVVCWDRRAPLIITDKEGRALVVFVGAPLGAKGSEWEGVATRAVETMSTVRQAGFATQAFPDALQTHRRGNFVAVAVGVSHGNGRLRPGNLHHPPNRMPLVRQLLSDPDIKRIAGYQSSVLSLFAPKLYRHYCHRLSLLFEHEPYLQRNFPNSIFPAVSFNLGPTTVSRDHTDSLNVGYGLCALAALGSFDAQKGGHLILFDLGLLVEFASGDVAALPSAILRHGNTAIQDGEERYSMAQYCAGGLLQYVDYGYTTASSAMKGKSKQKRKEVKQALDGDHEDRVQAALDMFSFVDKLDDDRQEVFSQFASFVRSGAPS